MNTRALSPKHEKMLLQAQSSYAAGRTSDAITTLRKLTKAIPANPLYLAQLGQLLLEVGAMSDGVQYLERSLRINPKQPDVTSDLGLAYSIGGEHEKAIRYISEAISQTPDFPVAFNNRGLALHQLGRTEEALVDYDQALKLDSSYGSAWVNRGIALTQLRRFDDAVCSYDKAIVVDAKLDGAYSGRGVALHQAGRLDDALVSLDQALSMRPDRAGVWLNRGAVLLDMREACGAKESCERAIELRPDYAEAYSKLGEALIQLECFEEALAALDRSILLDPDAANPHYKKACLLLKLGQYELGWRLYEWRWRIQEHVHRRYASPSPLWVGDDCIRGKTILVRPEQGLGDFIQFSRYVPALLELGAAVVMETPRPLLALMSAAPWPVTVIGVGDERPAHDFQCPVMSLPLAFDTSLASIPQHTPYLNADNLLVDAWRERLGPKSKMRIGLAWSGSPLNEDDQNRSMALQQLALLLKLPMEFHCLQKEVRPADQAVAQSIHSLHIYQAPLNEFSETAALIEALDLVITVDTSIAHLAGALGKPVWILLNKFADFRWLQERSDSPWYPTAVLFRQAISGCWEGVVQDVCTRLAQNDS